MRSYSKKRDGKGAPRKLAPLGSLTLRRKPGHAARCLIAAGPRIIHGAIGRSGISAFKREGDGATPLAAMKLLAAYVRPGRRWPPTRLAVRPVRPDLGWCDAPAHPSYNRPVRLPFRASHETMTRQDHLYDAVVVLDWNIAPRRRGRGSAIFLHLARPGFLPTEGCVAVSQGDMRWLLSRVSKNTVLRVIR